MKKEAGHEFHGPLPEKKYLLPRLFLIVNELLLRLENRSHPVTR